MKAEEAKKKSLENQMNVDEALKLIEGAAKNGFTTAILDYPKNLSDQGAMDLMNLGYKIHKHTDPIMCVEKYVASW